MSYHKTVGYGGCGKCRVYYSEKYKRKVIEKEVGTNFLRMRSENTTRLTTLIKDYKSNENLLKKESVMMMLTKIAKLDCCVEILDFGGNPFKIIMEYCEGGDLRKILDKYEVPILDKIWMISQILAAIKKIHEFYFIHGDLKCANIFLAKKYIPGDRKNIRIKIGDFGLSEIGGNLIHGGTPGFIAPEVKTFGGSFESDIYSIGKVMLEIMTQLPVPIIAAINIESLNTLKEHLPKILNVSEFYNIVIPCLAVNPKKRPDANLLFEGFHGLMDFWADCEEMNEKILKKYRIGDKAYVDCHEHLLTLSNDKMRQYKGNQWYCNFCNNQDKCFLSNTLSFNCISCNYDLCYKCIEVHNSNYVNNKMLEHVPKGKKIYVKFHQHPLLLSSKEERNYPGYYWICDICKFNASNYVYSFNCKKCTYDVCLNCCEKNFQIREEEGKCCIIY